MLFFFCYFFVFSSYQLCASLMSRLVLDIMLLQRLGVIGIVLILIYSLYQKKNSHTQNYMHNINERLYLCITYRLLYGRCTLMFDSINRKDELRTQLTKYHWVR